MRSTTQTAEAGAGRESLVGQPEEAQQIALSSLRDEQGAFRTVEVRGKLSQSTVAAYRELLERGGQFKDPIVVYEVTDRGDERYLAAGWHRSTAAFDAGRETLPGYLRRGTWLEALRAAIATNAEHGHRPTRDDVAATLALLDQQEEYATLSNGDKAALIGCSASTVANAYEKLGGRKTAVITQRNGATYTRKAPSSHGVKMEDARGDGASDDRRDMVPLMVPLDMLDTLEAARDLRHLARRAQRLMNAWNGRDATALVLSAYKKGQDQGTLDAERAAVRWLVDLLGMKGGR